MSGRAASVVAQAKVNLFLRVLAREESGYHQLETLFCRLTLGDRVRVEPTDGDWHLSLTGPALPAAGLGDPRTNLAWRAAAVYREASGWPAGAHIAIEKHIPVGGGLGGGSADAGAVLRLLDALAPSPLGASRVLQLAATLGADIPFLTQEASALALGYGRGDRLITLPALPSRPCTLVVAPFGVSTSHAYRALAAARLGTGAPGGTMVKSADLCDWSAVAGLSCNEFEPVVFGLHPELGRALRSLTAPGLSAGLARMSGSGSTLFRVGEEPGEPLPTLPPGFSALRTSTADHVEGPVLE